MKTIIYISLLALLLLSCNNENNDVIKNEKIDECHIENADTIKNEKIDETLINNKKIDNLILDIIKRDKEVNSLEKKASKDDYYIKSMHWGDETEGFPGVGTKGSSFEFHYYKMKLIKLIHSYQIAAKTVYKVFLYDENRDLIFYSNNNDWYDGRYEQRVYFHKSKLIQYYLYEDEEETKYRLKNFNEIHHKIASDILKESEFNGNNNRMNWFPNDWN